VTLLVLELKVPSLHDRGRRSRVVPPKNDFWINMKLSGFLFPIISLLLLAAFVAIPVRADTVDFTIITTKGWVRYTVGSNWSVLWMEPRRPELRAAFRFQIQRIQAPLTRQTSLLSRSKMNCGARSLPRQRNAVSSSNQGRRFGKITMAGRSFRSKRSKVRLITALPRLQRRGRRADLCTFRVAPLSEKPKRL
jgi:hypothetical protein